VTEVETDRNYEIAVAVVIVGPLGEELRQYGPEPHAHGGQEQDDRHESYPAFFPRVQARCYVLVKWQEILLVLRDKVVKVVKFNPGPRKAWSGIENLHEKNRRMSRKPPFFKFSGILPAGRPCYIVFCGLGAFPRPKNRNQCGRILLTPASPKSPEPSSQKPAGRGTAEAWDAAVKSWCPNPSGAIVQFPRPGCWRPPRPGSSC